MPNNSAAGAADLLKAFGLTPPGDAHPPGAALRDKPALLATYCYAAQVTADGAAQKSNCGCPSCAITRYEAIVGSFMLNETVRAAYTGDTSRLEAVAELVERMKAADRKP